MRRKFIPFAEELEKKLSLSIFASKPPVIINYELPHEDPLPQPESPPGADPGPVGPIIPPPLPPSGPIGPGTS